MRLHHERTELQDEASKKNLKKGRGPAPKLSKEDEPVICFPFGHRKLGPEEFASLPIKDLVRLELIGSQDPRGKDRPRLEQLGLGWGVEKDGQRRKLLHNKLFKGQPTIKVRKLLLFLIHKVGGFPDRSCHVQEAAANFQILVEVAVNHGCIFPEDRSFLQQAVRLSKGEVFQGSYASIFQCLADPDADIDLETANQVSPYVVVYYRNFRSKSPASHLNGRKRAAKHRSNGGRRSRREK